MKIAMVGSGATGSVFASFLKLGGADMYLVDTYKEHMDKVAASGMLFKNAGTGEDIHIDGFHTAYSPENIGVMDVVIILVKTTNTAEAIQSALPAIGPDTVVLSLQNGFGSEEVIAEYVRRDRIMYGSGQMGTVLPEPGVCVGKPVDKVYVHFGALERSEISDKVGSALVELFEKGGCPASYDEDIRFFVWNKAMRNCMGNALQGILRLPGGAMYGEDTTWLRLAVLREGCNVANAMGIDGDRIYNNWSTTPAPTAALDYYPSTAQDMIIYKRQTEIDSLTGAVVRYGKQYGVPTPVNETIMHMVCAIQSNYDCQYGAKDQ